MPLVTETYDNRPEAVAFAFGRVWYAGIQASRWSSTLFYSQVLTDKNSSGKCYQSADPTAEEINSLIDTDGGTIPLSGVGKVLRLITLTNTLVVLAENGVWTVSGGAEGFAPLAYFVNNISKIGCISARSVIEVEDSILFAADDGIYQVGVNESNQLVVSNITEAKIDTYYNSISFADKSSSVGIYDYKTKVYTLYYGVGNNIKNALNLRLKNGAWYPYTFDTDSANLPADFFLVTPFYSPRSRDNTGTKFLTYSDDSVAPFYTICEYNDGNFRDFGAANVPAYLETTAITLENPHLEKGSTFATFYFDITETDQTGINPDFSPIYANASSCLMTPKWSWPTSTARGGEGRQRQIYRLPKTFNTDGGVFDVGTDTLVVRDRVTGMGKSLSIRLDTEEGKDMRLQGYTVYLTMDGRY